MNRTNNIAPEDYYRYANRRLYIGLDLSTQQLKAIVIDDDCNVISQHVVNFHTELARYGTRNGIIAVEHGVVSSPVGLWLEAVDILMHKIRRAYGSLKMVNGISGCAQQHGTVYWTKEAEDALENLAIENDFSFIVKHFEKRLSPVWLDASTDEQCKRLETFVGSGEKVAEITGSRVYHRFSASQIAKVAEKEPEIYKNTSRISLISSFLTSIFVGHVAPIDESDGSGMNLLDIKTKKWSDICLQACAPPGSTDRSKFAAKLKHRLSGDSETEIAPTNSEAGLLSRYLALKYGMSRNCPVYTFTGDNPSSLAGLCVGKDMLVISLGTSDTVFFETATPKIQPYGHIMLHPFLRDRYMAMTCFKNGSLMRERIREKLQTSWEELTAALKATPPGNKGCMGLYYDYHEIAPPVKSGEYRFDADNKEVKEFSRDVEIRAMFEGQIIAKLAYALRLGWKRKGTIIVTGGASVNETFLQLIADIFELPVQTIDVENSAALGGALRARYGTEFATQLENMKFHQVLRTINPTSPREFCYDGMVERYKKLEAHCLMHYKL